MQDNITKLPRGKCANCGKIIPILSTRDQSGNYCGRICATLKKFKKRFTGSMAGPADRPKFDNKTGKRI